MNEMTDDEADRLIRSLLSEIERLRAAESRVAELERERDEAYSEGHSDGFSEGVYHAGGSCVALAADNLDVEPKGGRR